MGLAPSGVVRRWVMPPHRYRGAPLSSSLLYALKPGQRGQLPGCPPPAGGHPGFFALPGLPPGKQCSSPAGSQDFPAAFPTFPQRPVHRLGLLPPSAPFIASGRPSTALGPFSLPWFRGSAAGLSPSHGGQCGISRKLWGCATRRRKCHHSLKDIFPYAKACYRRSINEHLRSGTAHGRWENGRL